MAADSIVIITVEGFNHWIAAYHRGSPRGSCPGRLSGVGPRPSRRASCAGPRLGQRRLPPRPDLAGIVEVDRARSGH